jgi:hypothetical protein
VELGEIEAIASDGQPVAGTMDGITIEQELAGDKLPEGEFGWVEHGMKFASFQISGKKERVNFRIKPRLPPVGSDSPSRTRFRRGVARGSDKGRYPLSDMPLRTPRSEGNSIPHTRWSHPCSR